MRKDVMQKLIRVSDALEVAIREQMKLPEDSPIIKLVPYISAVNGTSATTRSSVTFKVQVTGFDGVPAQKNYHIYRQQLDEQQTELIVEELLKPAPTEGKKK